MGSKQEKIEQLKAVARRKPKAALAVVESVVRVRIESIEIEGDTNLVNEALRELLAKLAR